MVNVSYLTLFISLNNQPCMTRSTFIDLNPHGYNQVLRYYSFMVNLDRCNRNCNTFDDLSYRICVSNKTADLNLSVFNVITRINEPKTLAKHTACKRKRKFDGRKCNSNQKCNNDKCWCDWKNPRKNQVCEKYFIWNPGICTRQNGKYLEIIMGDSKIPFDKIIKETEN